MIFKKTRLGIAALFGIAVSFTACDDEFVEVGGEVIENPTDIDFLELEVGSYTQDLKSVQTNNLTDYQLGAYNHPVYGLKQASILTQLSLGSTPPAFGTEPELDSVVMSIPYYSREGESNDAGDFDYILDSIFGNQPFKLSIYESGYFLNDLDPDADFQDAQKYYSDQQDVFEQNIVGEALYVDENFRPSSNEIVDYEFNGEENDTIVSPPALRIKLPVSFFEQKILDRAGSSQLSNNNNFRNYFRGLFIKAEAINNDGSLIFLNPASGRVRLYYTNEQEIEDEDGETQTARLRNQYTFNFGSNVVNTFRNEKPGDVTAEIEDSQNAGAARNLYLQGGEGSIAVIDLFEDEAELQELRERNWIFNEASLKLYVNQEKMSGLIEPERLIVYDLTNNRMLADYGFSSAQLRDLDQTNPLNSMTTFSKPLERGEDENGIFYKVMLTQHVRNILNNDGDNVKLGLAVVQNINRVGLVGVRNSGEVKRVPTSTVEAPFGTVIHGNFSDDEEKRLKLRIYYTETE